MSAPRPTCLPLGASIHCCVAYRTYRRSRGRLLRGCAAQSSSGRWLVAYVFFAPQQCPPDSRPALFVHSSCRVSQNIASGRDFIDALSAEVAELEAEIAEAAEATDLETARQEVHTFVTRHAIPTQIVSDILTLTGNTASIMLPSMVWISPRRQQAHFKRIQ